MRCFALTVLAASALTAEEPVAGYNLPCRIELDSSWDVFTWGSFTFWQPLQDNMQLGVASSPSGSASIVDGYEVVMNGNYRPGFKVGAGMNFNYDNWDSLLQYTWFRGTEKKSVDFNGNGSLILFPAWQIASLLNPQYVIGRETWKLSMDLADWLLERKYQVGEELCFNSSIGLRAAFIRQSVDVRYINTSAGDLAIWPSTTVSQSTHSWGLGPELALSSDWTIYKGLRVRGTGEVDTLFTQYTVHANQTSDNSSSNYFVKEHHLDAVKLHTALELGLGWGRFFVNNAYHIDLAADYTFQTFFSQNMFRSFVSSTAMGTSSAPHGNLYIQGLTISLRLDF